MPQACYRELRAYKYQLVEDYETQINIIPPRDLIFKFVVLTSQGKLWIKKDYAWDGPSGPTIDTKNFMRGSLVHDALYQLMRLGELDYKVYRQRADELLRDICREDGMSSFRSWYVYQGVRLFGESSARPVPEPEVTIICVP
ncbi:MAG TPA: DUF1353 domain-containing protein [Acidobacteriota bacterium]|nr:DUF1353 domain-containing protein [Acidobacteriota bacterium]HND19575.1 DUF1353 domain-containing protein [Acidobacteriota bacterium]